MNLKIKQKIKKYPALFNILRILKKPIQSFIAYRDLLKTIRDLQFIHHSTFPSPKYSTVLVSTLEDMIYEAKILSAIGLALKMNGHKISILISNLRPWQIRFFRAFGHCDLIFWEDIKLSKQDCESVKLARDQFLSQELSFPLVKKWQYRGSRIGPLLLSRISRENHSSAPSLLNPFTQNELSLRLSEILGVVHRGEYYLDQAKPDFMVAVEINGADLGPVLFSAIKKGIDVIQVVQPSKDDALIFKRLTPQSMAFHPNSLDLKTMEKIKDLPWSSAMEDELNLEFSRRYGGHWFLQSRNQPAVEEMDKNKIISQLKLDPKKKIAVVFSHVLWDANLFYGEDLFADYGDWFIQTIDAAVKNPNLNWLIKMHPANIWKRKAEKRDHTQYTEVSLIEQTIGKLPDHVILLYPDTPISTYSLFQNIDYAITVRGTTGIEAPCFGITTLTAGTGRYSGLGITVDSNTKDEYLEKLSRLELLPSRTKTEVELAKKHAYFLFIKRPWPLKSFKATFNYAKRGVTLLDHNLELNAKSMEEIKNNGDLNSMAQWIIRRDEIDYLSID